MLNIKFLRRIKSIRIKEECMCMSACVWDFIDVRHEKLLPNKSRNALS